MRANDTNHTNTKDLIHPELSYTLNGICFDTQNGLGRYAKERHYGDVIEKRLIELQIPFQRELAVPHTKDRVDFLVYNKIILELKAKRILTKLDYYQVQRYLQIFDIKLGILVNFRSEYLKPQRVVRIDTDHKSKFV